MLHRAGTEPPPTIAVNDDGAAGQNRNDHHSRTGRDLGITLFYTALGR